MPTITEGEVGWREAPALTALNETLREDYMADCAKGLERWNRILSETGQELKLPHVGFNRHVGVFNGQPVTPDGRLVSRDSHEKGIANDWLPTEEDRNHVASLMKPVLEPGKMADWIAAPSTGIHQKPLDFTYVRA